MPLRDDEIQEVRAIIREELAKITPEKKVVEPIVKSDKKKGKYN